jgi:hypothetical protein
MMVFAGKDRLPCGILAAPKWGNGGPGMLLAVVFALAAALSNIDPFASIILSVWLRGWG